MSQKQVVELDDKLLLLSEGAGELTHAISKCLINMKMNVKTEKLVKDLDVINEIMVDLLQEYEHMVDLFYIDNDSTTSLH